MEDDNDYVGQVIAEDTEARSPKRLSNDPAQPPAGYALCSPGLLESGVDCATAPRWSSPTWYGHSHWHPVPPAGEVEVLGYMDWASTFYPSQESVETYGQARHMRELVDRAHVTRLTVERDALKAEVERLNELVAKEGRHFDAVWQKGLDLNSELTKARELNEQLSIALSELDSTLRVVAVAGSKTALSSLRTLAKRSLNIVHGLLSDQSAPAAKDGE